jgi:uncharacterized protein (DUF433 family)
MTPILKDRVLLDLIERLEATRAQLDRLSTSELALPHFPMLTDNALRAAIDYLVQLREDRHAGIGNA